MPTEREIDNHAYIDVIDLESGAARVLIGPNGFPVEIPFASLPREIGEGDWLHIVTADGRIVFDNSGCSMDEHKAQEMSERLAAVRERRAARRS